MGFWKDFFSGSSGSGQTARNRLQVVLVHDRTDISPRLMEEMRKEIIAVVAKYMDIDTSKIELDLDRGGQAVALVANIPVLRVKRGGGGILSDAPRQSAVSNGNRE